MASKINSKNEQNKKAKHTSYQAEIKVTQLEVFFTFFKSRVSR